MAHGTSPLAELYDDVNRRLEKDGQAMPVSRDAFLATAEMQPGVLDVSLLDHVGNRAVFETAYLCLLSAIPGEETLRHWSKYLDTLPSSEFMASFLRVVLNRCSGGKHGVSIVNGEEYLGA